MSPAADERVSKPGAWASVPQMSTVRSMTPSIAAYSGRHGRPFPAVNRHSVVAVAVEQITAFP